MDGIVSTGKVAFQLIQSACALDLQGYPATAHYLANTLALLHHSIPPNSQPTHYDVRNVISLTLILIHMTRH